MRMVMQRVEKAAVRIAATGEEVGSVGKGLVCLVGVGKRDHRVDMEYCVKKCLGTRMWEDTSGKPWQRNVVDMDYDILVVSNFTLQAQTKKGFQPDFSRAMTPDAAKSMYEAFVENLKKAYKPERIQTGQFQTKMKIEVHVDGPVTLIVDTQEIQLKRDSAPALSGQTQTEDKDSDPPHGETPDVSS